MASDAHAHPLDLLDLHPNAEEERRSLNIACAASSCGKEEFLLHEKLSAAAKNEGAAPLFLCFAVHPQLPALVVSEKTNCSAADFRDQLELLSALAAENRISAVGECGFDLYSQNYKNTEAIQDELFAVHLEIAMQYNLPVVLHVRRAMHKIFPYVKILKELPAVIFHSWSGSPDEASALLRKGIPAFFSLGTTLLLNHKKAIQSFASLPAERLLLETDAPYQPLQGKMFSSWPDMPAILEAAAKIRKEAGTMEGTNAIELEEIVDRNFFGIFKSE
ncbi:MAG: TatD family hydrolase [Treponema sp.]|nr:TatD family hydrolase [Treponema sp.]